MTKFLIRLFDITFSLLGLIVGMPVLLLLLLIGLFDTGAPLFMQQRVGLHQKPFILVKFRTMKKNTAHVASHLASRGDITPFGHFLRSSKLDELPQLWNVLKGEMSLVGPRPCLISQTELIEERQKYGVFSAKPGITGFAQINNIDMSTPILLTKADLLMIQSLNLVKYFKYILKTLLGKGVGDSIVSHDLE